MTPIAAGGRPEESAKMVSRSANIAAHGSAVGRVGQEQESAHPSRHRRACPGDLDEAGTVRP
jgi:hypothetical protein